MNQMQTRIEEIRKTIDAVRNGADLASADLDDLTWALDTLEKALRVVETSESLKKFCHHDDCQGEERGKYRCDNRCNWNKFEKALTAFHTRDSK